MESDSTKTGIAEIHSMGIDTTETGSVALKEVPLEAALP